ncbi:nucleoside triphosphate pyrophosphohydrolase [Pseudohalioglobus lutimaris]|uniref:Nucleoside triphosphate pyrophosphohydrolase n=1 Tax=Pseudohalioglobus lutimaris TaxID=1737061 RepID=A0A2N5X0K6_9GAMM|nr:nucleoside triphosphate pyrophosphohydrolase [Pseudohalioglobus lutimaris]PLW68021.1 nucleoside triphosphate pyrophosphohydrolase [Pseudohalioglobus lutimaris]
MTQRTYTIDDLIRVMERLRDPERGCPWDLQQDFRSIVPSTLEECYELAHAIEHDDFEHVAEELGDVLFQVIFYAQLGREQGIFDFGKVVDTLVEKLVRRHPHVFAGGDIEGVVGDDRIAVGQVNATWEAIKQQERGQREQHGVLDDIPVALPALPRAQKLQKRAARVGFDWRERASVIDKLDEEITELRSAIADKSSQAIHEEMGDLLFTCVNLCRHLSVNAESALRDSSSKFERRFRCMEAFAAEEGTSLTELDDTALDLLWERAKQP